MTNILSNKIDFTVLFTVKDANPNGDPLNGNRPRQDFNGFGEVSDVAIKRKIRNRLQDLEQSIFVQSQDNTRDHFNNLRDRAEGNEELKSVKNDRKAFAIIANKSWFDVRAFGQVFAFKGTGKDSGVSVGIRGPVSVQSAKTLEAININSMQITKSVNSEPGDKKGSDTMGMKHKVDFGVYKFSGSINPQLAEKTGFTAEDALLIKKSLETLFDNDASSARPEGSMEVRAVYWWEHNSKLGQYSSAQVHRALKVSLTGNQDEPFEVTKDELLENLNEFVYEV
ncbi:type I-C CRISPR-associated protein Cas7/Csd2 [Kurthia sibirica]|uniref:Type I-C CRISPR-associated protein Cas7/Csd2 n=1 Tax=Kurthia sibirica TaxID=202750 RepID=A0A2U3APE7_9BACL|nr:type I-C CRISPR-associated protein Cas7/Csd2 [Kurthia sibirica]PWI26430.1 type I-C CRISPR-associated protein Cas7/Csd2 [Kurthia sibirica]GEK32995.1 type I-C CRISPR-associated protein Cas7/Csd2 [Kurthia sibirica]